MNVFLPLLRSSNSFLDELEKKFDGKFIYDYYENIDQHQVDIINIHWPESVFINNNYDYENFKAWLLKIKEKIPVVYTRHNTLPHRILNEDSVAFNDFVNMNCNAVHHFGQFSLEEFKKLYPKYLGMHSVIPHPYYTGLENSADFIKAREKLGIGLDKKIILVFGTIRNDDERNFILNFFNSLNLKNSVLLVPNFGYFQACDSFKNIRFGTVYSKLKTFFSRRKNRILGSSYVADEDIQYYFKACNILFIPRVKALNSGVLYLGLTFDVKIVAPRAGNITELVKGPNVIYDANNLKGALQKIRDLIVSDEKRHDNAESEEFSSQIISQKLNIFFRSVINKHHNKSLF